MCITQETDYAMRIMYCLAGKNTRCEARVLGEEMCVSLRFALKILGKLASAGLVKSFKGNRGGYELARPAGEITMLDVLCAVEGPCRLSRCVEGVGSCNRGVSGACAFQRVYKEISDIANERLASVNFADLVTQSICSPE